MMSQRKQIAIVGTGLIGGSLALRLHEKKLSSHLIGVDNDEKHAEKALALELVDEILPVEEAIQRSEVIILAIPVDAIKRELSGILDRIDGQIVIDLGSTKQQLIESVKNHRNRGRYVAAHPMWGTEYSGPESALREAFTAKAVVICDPDACDADALVWTRHMFEKIGMRILDMEAEAHDLHAAYVSHISHVTSFALANTVLEKEKEDNAIFNMASGGFESTVRLAKSNPLMWLPIFLHNRVNVLDVLNEHIGQLEKFRDALYSGDESKLIHWMENANRIRRIVG